MSEIIRQVNMDAGKAFSQYCFGLAKETWNNSPFLRVEREASTDTFRGDTGVSFCNLPAGWIQDIAADGVGNKPELISLVRSDRLGVYRSAATNLIAMTCGDIVRKGGVPLFITNILTVSSVDQSQSDENNQLVRELMLGLRDAARIEKVIMYRGETAQHGHRMGEPYPDASPNFDWCGVAVGAKHPSFRINESKLEPGQIIVGIRDKGIRCNGNSTVCAALEHQFGPQWRDNSKAQTWIQAAAAPSTLWGSFLAKMNGWYDWKELGCRPIIPIHAIAHITEGGIPEKLGEDILFPRGLSATFDNLEDPPQIMLRCKEWLDMDDERFYRTFHGGPGVLVVVPSKKDAEKIIHEAGQTGLTAWECGKITVDAERSTVSILRPSTMPSISSNRWIPFSQK